MSGRVAILDVDGTLVDSNYQHAIAWFRAFREHDVAPPIWRIHRHIGMGGDQLVAAVAGEEVERECGDAVRDAEKRLYSELVGEVCAFEGATELVERLASEGSEVVLASSAKQDEVEHYVELLGAAELVSSFTTASDVEKTKPEPDLILAALEKAEGGDAVMVGDSTWDIEAAERAGIPTVAVLTGGFS
ncbi:MAG: HAD family hydrolase, partial [Solirubrobacterales bacterium]|nr:HAD family hydrolase [Solirubrobacterales bacterium]